MTSTKAIEGQTEGHEGKKGEESADGLDDVLASLGMGRWHLWVIACNVMVCMMMAINLAGSPFMAPSVPFRCLSPFQDAQNSSHFDNKCYLSESEVRWTRESINSSWEAVLPDGEGDGGVGEEGGGDCPYGYEYDTSVFTSTVATEWNLVCDRKALQPLFQTVVSFGSIVGNIIAGNVADIFGRRTPIRFGAVLNLAASVMVYFAPFYWIVLAGRFFLGLTCSLIVYPAFNLAIEMTPPKYRSLMGMLLGLPYSLGVFALSGVAYLIRDWRMLQAVISIPAFLFLPTIVMVDESPRWLMQNDRGEEAVKVLQKAAKLHKAKIPSERALQTLADAMLQAARKREFRRNSMSVNWMVDFKRGILQFVKTPAMRTITLLMPTVWFMQNICYLGILLNANNFSSDNPFVYVAVNSVMEIPAVLLGTPLTYRFGRRIVITLGFLVAGIFSIAVPFLPQDLWILQWIIVVTGYLSTAGAFQVNFIYAPELFPTTLRARGASLCSLVGHMGFVVTPFVVKFLAESPVPPSFLFGICGLTASAIVPFFPETNNQTLCEVVQDVEERSKTQRSLWSSCCSSLKRKDPETIPTASEKTNPGFVPDSTEVVSPA